MPGGLLQIATTGSQDNIFISNPEFSYFKTVYKKYSNFSQELKNITCKNNLNFESKTKIEIHKNGDLLKNIYEKIRLPSVKAEYLYSIDDEIKKILSDNNTFIVNNQMKDINLTKLNALDNYFNNYGKIVRTNDNEYLYTQNNINSGNMLDFENLNADRIVGQLDELRIPSNGLQYQYLTKDINQLITNGASSDNINNNYVSKIVKLSHTDNISYTFYFDIDISNWTLYDPIYKKISNDKIWLNINQENINTNNFIRYGYIYQLSKTNQTKYLRVAKIKIDNFTNNSITGSLIDGEIKIGIEYYFSNIDILDTVNSPEIDYSIDMYDNDDNIIICVGDKRNRKFFYYIFNHFGSLLNKGIIVNNTEDNDFGFAIKIIDSEYLCVSAPLVDKIYIYKLINYEYEILNIYSFLYFNNSNIFQVINDNVLFGYSIDYSNKIVFGMPNYNFNGGFLLCDFNSGIISNPQLFSYKNITSDINNFIKSSIGFSVHINNNLLLTGVPYSFNGEGSVIKVNIHNLLDYTIYRPQYEYNFGNISSGNNIKTLNLNIGQSYFGWSIDSSEEYIVISGIGDNEYCGAVWMYDNNMNFVDKYISNDNTNTDELRIGSCAIKKSENLNGNIHLFVYGAHGENNMEGAIRQYIYDFGTWIFENKIIHNGSILIKNNPINIINGIVEVNGLFYSTIYGNILSVNNIIEYDQNLIKNGNIIFDNIYLNNLTSPIAGNYINISGSIYINNGFGNVLISNTMCKLYGNIDIGYSVNIDTNYKYPNFGKKIKMNKIKKYDYMLISGCNRKNDESLTIWLYQYDKINRSWYQRYNIDLPRYIDIYEYNKLETLPITNVAYITNITNINTDNKLSANINIQTLNDPYNYIINYLQSLQYNNDIKNNPIITSDKILDYLVDYISDKIFKTYNILTLKYVPQWSYKKILLDKEYNIIYLYIKKNISNSLANYEHVCTGIIIDSSNTMIKISILYGIIDLTNSELSDIELYVSPIGLDDKYLVNNYTLGLMNTEATIKTTPNYLAKVIKNEIIQDNELRLYDRLVKSNNKFVKNNYNDTTRIVYITIDTDIKEWFNLLNFHTNNNINNIYVSGIINYFVTEKSYTIIRVIISSPTILLNNNSYLSYNNNIIQISYFKLIDSDNMIYEIKIDKNIISWFIDKVYINKDLINFAEISTLDTDCILKIEGIILNDVNNIIIGKYYFKDNDSEININNILLNYYIYPSTNSSFYGKIINIEYINYDNVNQYNYNYEKNIYLDNVNIINNIYNNRFIGNNFTNYMFFHANIDGIYNLTDNDTTYVGFGNIVEKSDINNSILSNTIYNNLINIETNQYEYYLINEFNNQLSIYTSSKIDLIKKILFYRYNTPDRFIKIKFNVDTDLLINTNYDVYTSPTSDICAKIYICSINTITKEYTINLTSSIDSLTNLVIGVFVKKDMTTFYQINNINYFWNDIEDKYIENALNNFDKLDDIYIEFNTINNPINNGNLFIDGFGNLTITGNIRLNDDYIIIQCNGGNYDNYNKLYINVDIGTNCHVHGIYGNLQIHNIYKIPDSHSINYLMNDYWLKGLGYIYSNYTTLNNVYISDSIINYPIYFENNNNIIQKEYTYYDQNNIYLDSDESYYNILDIDGIYRYKLGKIIKNGTKYKVSDTFLMDRIIQGNLNIDGKRLYNITTTGNCKIFGNIGQYGNIYDGNVFIANVPITKHNLIIDGNIVEDLNIYRNINVSNLIIYPNQYLVSKSSIVKIDNIEEINGYIKVEINDYLYDTFANLMDFQKYNISYSQDKYDTKFGEFFNIFTYTYYFSVLTDDSYITIGNVKEIIILNENIYNNNSIRIIFNEGYIGTAITIGETIILRKNSSWKTYNYCKLQITNHNNTNYIDCVVLKFESFVDRFKNRVKYIKAINDISINPEFILINDIYVGNKDYIKISLNINNYIDWFDNLVIGNDILIKEGEIIISSIINTLNIKDIEINSNVNGNIIANLICITNDNIISGLIDNIFYINNNINITKVLNVTNNNTHILVNISNIESYSIGNNINIGLNMNFEEIIMHGIIDNINTNNNIKTLHINVDYNTLYQLIPELTKNTIIYGSILNIKNISSKLYYYSNCNVDNILIDSFNINNHNIIFNSNIDLITGNIYTFKIDQQYIGNIIINQHYANTYYAEYIDSYFNLDKLNIPKINELNMSILNSDDIIIINNIQYNNTININCNNESWIDNLKYGSYINIHWNNIDLTTICISDYQMLSTFNIIGNICDIDYNNIFRSDKDDFLNKIIKYNNIKYNKLQQINDELNIDRHRGIGNIDSIGKQFNFTIKRIFNDKYIIEPDSLIKEQWNWLGLNNYGLKNTKRTLGNILKNINQVYENINIDNMKLLLYNYQQDRFKQDGLYQYDLFIKLFKNDIERYLSYYQNIFDVRLNIGNSSYNLTDNILDQNNIIYSKLHNGIVHSNIDIIVENNIYEYENYKNFLNIKNIDVYIPEIYSSDIYYMRNYINDKIKKNTNRLIINGNLSIGSYIGKHLNISNPITGNLIHINVDSQYNESGNIVVSGSFFLDNNDLFYPLQIGANIVIIDSESIFNLSISEIKINYSQFSDLNLGIIIDYVYDENYLATWKELMQTNIKFKIVYNSKEIEVIPYRIFFEDIKNRIIIRGIPIYTNNSDIYFINNLMILRKFTKGSDTFYGNVIYNDHLYKWDNNIIEYNDIYINEKIINSIIIDQNFNDKYKGIDNQKNYYIDYGFYSTFIDFRSKLTIDYNFQSLKDEFKRYYNDIMLLEYYRKNLEDLDNIIEKSNICTSIKTIIKKINNVNVSINTFKNIYDKDSTIYNEDIYKGLIIQLIQNIDLLKLNNIEYLVELFRYYNLYLEENNEDDNDIILKYSKSQINILVNLNSNNIIKYYLDNTLDDKQKILLFLMNIFHTDYIIEKIVNTSGNDWVNTYFNSDDIYTYYKGEVVTIDEKNILSGIVSNIEANIIEYNIFNNIENEIPKIVYTNFRSYNGYKINGKINEDYRDINYSMNNNRDKLINIIETANLINTDDLIYIGNSNIEVQNYILYKNCIITNLEFKKINDLNGNIIIPSNKDKYNNLNFTSYNIDNFTKINPIIITRNNHTSGYTLWNDCIIKLSEQHIILQNNKYSGNLEINIDGNISEIECKWTGYISSNIISNSTSNLVSSYNGFNINTSISNVFIGNVISVISSNLINEYIPNNIIKDGYIYRRNNELIRGFKYNNGKIERTLIYDDKKYRIFDSTYIIDSLHQLILYYNNENIESNFVTTPYTYTDSNIQTVLRLLLYNRNIKNNYGYDNEYSDGYDILYKYLNHKSMYWKNALWLYDMKNSNLLNIFDKYDTKYFFNNKISVDFKVNNIYNILLDDIFNNYYGIINPYINNGMINISNDEYIDQVFKFSTNYIYEKNNLITKYELYNNIKNDIINSKNRKSNPLIKWVDYIGCKLIKNIKFIIGDQIITQFDNDWILITSLLNGKYGHIRGFANMIGNIPKLNMPSTELSEYTIYQPIPFWFCFKNALAIPILNIIYNKIYIEIEIEKIENLLVSQNKYIKYIFDDINDKPNFRLNIMPTYVYLDQSEREKFAESRHEYIIEQVQTLPLYKTIKGDNNIKMGFSNCVKEIYWISKYNNLYVDGINNIYFKFNGIDRFKPMQSSYFHLIPFYENKYNILNSNISLYSFGINTKLPTPSGSCNFSMLDSARMLFESSGSYDLKIYGKSFNLLRIMSGYAGLAYY
jgi:hypothetical protein